MRKFKINKNPKEKEPSAEQVKRYKDFASLSHQYERVTKRSGKRLYQDPKLFILLFLLGLIAFLIFLES